MEWFAGISLVILSACVLVDKLHKNNQDFSIKNTKDDKKIEVCHAQTNSKKHKRNWVSNYSKSKGFNLCSFFN